MYPFGRRESWGSEIVPKFTCSVKKLHNWASYLQILNLLLNKSWCFLRKTRERTLAGTGASMPCSCHQKSWQGACEQQSGRKHKSRTEEILLVSLHIYCKVAGGASPRIVYHVGDITNVCHTRRESQRGEGLGDKKLLPWPLSPVWCWLLHRVWSMWLPSEGGGSHCLCWGRLGLATQQNPPPCSKVVRNQV